MVKPYVTYTTTNVRGMGVPCCFLRVVWGIGQACSMHQSPVVVVARCVCIANRPACRPQAWHALASGWLPAHTLLTLIAITVATYTLGKLWLQ
jgi:hypothetical protein